MSGHPIPPALRAETIHRVLAAAEHLDMPIGWLNSQSHGAEIQIQRSGTPRYTLAEAGALIAQLGATETGRGNIPSDDAFATVTARFAAGDGTTITLTIYIEPLPIDDEDVPPNAGSAS